MTTPKTAPAPSLTKLMARLAELRDRVPAREQVELEAVTKLVDVERELRAAVKAENYERAAELKRQRGELETRRDVAREALKVLNQERGDVLTQASTLYFAEKGAAHFAQGAEVTRVVVVDPVTEDADSVDYVDSCDNVTLRVGDRSFDSEAYHIAGWAAENGFLVGLKRGRVVFDA